jgi:YfiH family protein
MAADLGLDAARLCWCDQVHEPRIALVRSGDAGGPLERCDAVVTAEAGRPLMTFSADCPLVLVHEPRAGCLGLAHAGWRNTVVQLARRLVERLRDEFGARPDRMLAGIGPSAGPERYEVGEEVYEAAGGLPDRERLFPRAGGRMCFDLWAANRAQLVAAGVPAAAIEIAGVCTITDADTFFSYRREGPGCGLFALAAALA